MEVSGQVYVSGSFAPKKKSTAVVEYEAEWVPEGVWTFCRRE